MKYMICIILLLSSLLSKAQENPLLSSFEEYQKAKASTQFDLKSISIGPVLNSARLDAIQVDPQNNHIIYAGFGSGGLWKSIDNGLTWKIIFEHQASQGIGDIALAPSNPSILYVATGESLKKPRNFTFPGTGIYRSNDAGATWKHLGLSQSWHIGEIVVHPQDPNIVFVAVLGHFWSTNSERGVYRTIDGGASWEKVLYTNEHTGANDIVIAPSNPAIIYASMWEHDPELSGPNSGIYKSTDGGQTWVKLPTGLPLGAKIGRIGLAVSYQDPDVVYGLVDNLNKERNNAAEVYKTSNGGISWRKTHEKDLLIFPGIGWYFTDIYVNPQNDEEIYALGVGLAHSSNSGKDFEIIRGNVHHLKSSAAQTLHLDHCELWVNPGNPNHLVLGNDGGLYVSYDKGKNWLHHNNIPVGEFYDITYDNQTPYQVYGGVQDNATVYGPAKSYKANFDDPWRYLWIDAWSGGDGCVTQVDPQNPNTVYFSMQLRGLRRKDLKNNSSKSIRPGFNDPSKNEILSYNFIAPYFLSSHDPHTLYHGGNYIFKSTNRGDQWTCISPDLSIAQDSTKKSLATGAIAESPLKAGLLYAGTDKGIFWYSPDDGNTWQNNSTGLPLAYIRSICPSPHQVGQVYVAASGLNYDDYENHLYKSEDNGKNWQKISANLPNETANVILADPIFPDILYAGLLRGVYISIDGGKNWSLLSTTLPAVSVADLEIQPREKDLLIATHGRGIYKLSLAPIHEAAAKRFKLSKTHLFTLPSFVAPKRVDTHRDIDQRTVEPFPISFWLDGKRDVHLEVQKDGQKIWEHDLKGKSGFNQFLWDLQISEAESNYPYFIHFKKYLDPGDYQLIFKASSQQINQVFEVK